MGRLWGGYGLLWSYWGGVGGGMGPKWGEMALKCGVGNGGGGTLNGGNWSEMGKWPPKWGN